MAIDFGADYNHGGPPRWSLVAVEIFVTRSRENQCFSPTARSAAKLGLYAGGIRGVSAEPLLEAMWAVTESRREMLRGVNDPEAWGPVLTFASHRPGRPASTSPISTPSAFADQYNQGLAA